MLRVSPEYRWLRRLGVEERDVIRAMRLARRAALVRSNDEAAVAVPSQRLGSYRRSAWRAIATC